MKKVFLVIAIAGGFLLANNSVQAQTKIGYFSLDQMVQLLPEYSKVDSLLERFRVDTLGAMYEEKYKELVYKDSILTKTDTSKMPKSVLNQIKQEVQMLTFQIGNWQSLSQQEFERKQNELFAPLYTKVHNALKAVSKEKGYNYVLDKSIFLVAPDGDDLLPFVATKLGVKLPTPTGGTQRPPVKQ
jgi:outer membrane protein